MYKPYPLQTHPENEHLFLLDGQTYKIVRCYHPSQNKENEVIKTGLTLEEAREHCNDKTTATDEYFDGYREE